MVHEASDIKLNQPNYVVYSQTNHRDKNEDSFQIFALTPVLGQKPVTIMAVADGMGGHAYGEYVSEQTLRKLSLSLFEQLTIELSLNRGCPEDKQITLDNFSQVLLKAVEQANAYVRKMVEANKWGKAGSTVLVTAIVGNVAVSVNLGDSPLFHYQASSGKLTKVTQEHTVADVLLRAGMITQEMARSHEGRNRLEFYVGCPQFPPNLAVQQVSLTPGDLLLLCTDGISGSLLLEEIQSILGGDRTSLALKAESLIQAAQTAGETDNQTLILWKVVSC
ncbi:SpoIIE family protein phosphatase [Scytonema sp. UIC 10036]|uniref:PP2C family protein-serine/threonine phosphatase n=1 Tax=Scytonema sp. UIC 10036 TaxID=2304196 RepID=UPI0012DA9600|nr:protein phosphatase 2C domain-containing protein [Scytonema sp. UIC 10036]MUG98484.1 SpoIIE family protein phosphatase [Scytonema sp. UIC 10036]